MTRWIAPLTLTGQHATLVPLTAAHAAPLAQAVRDGELWRLWYTSVPAPEQMAAEIDSTWYAVRVQHTPLNTECKLMLLGHAFETLGCIAVEFRTHFFNQASRRAIERLGARLDGVLRNHQRAANGTLRDTCVYSILESEWPTVKTHLRWQLDK